jgi:hypothetical protein
MPTCLGGAPEPASMLIILLLTLINIVLIVHAARRGRFSPWVLSF